MQTFPSQPDLTALRNEFPILGTRVHGHPLIYLDNAATTQKPRVVIERLKSYYEKENANIHRGIHALSARATAAYEAARETVAGFIGATDAREVIFVRGATEAINLVAQTWGRQHLRAGEEILITEMEHHANIVPWQMLAKEKGARLAVVAVDASGQLDMADFAEKLGGQVRLAAFTHVSNALGTLNPVRSMIEQCRTRGIPVLLDASQSVPHLPLKVSELGADFLVFSGHKVFGPTGIGVLWGRAEVLAAMPPWQGGGDMIDHVSFEGTTFKGIPERFEAGTPAIAGAIGLASAMDFLQQADFAKLAQWEQHLTSHAVIRLGQIQGLRLVGTPQERVGVVSFVLEGVHPQDAATLLDLKGIAIRTGHHCAEPLMRKLGLTGTLRASFAFYNTPEEVETLALTLEKIRDMCADEPRS